ncbi:MAG: protein O-mannosyl-transferase family [Candidatus Cryptobacteroides sp.]
MDNKRFTFWNRITATVVFLVSLVTYLMTIEPTASFWDCGEFIASSYKLEVGHPPGNPVFQLFARFFTIFTDNMHAAMAVNALSALCSALTIFFLYLTVVFFAKRLVKARPDGSYSVAGAIAIFGSGAVGALVYCFSDTFWFSAVEAEVYAMSSLFTALVVWAMTRWYDQADTPYANRWIVLISFLMGLSVGVHLLNLLAIPALVFLFYYRRRENGTFSFWEDAKIFAISCIIIAVVLWGIIPYLPKAAAYTDLFFVNVLGMPFNTGAIFFMVAILALCFWGLFATLKKGKVFLNTSLLCLTTIIIGFSVFSIIIIRSSVKTPTNEYQPDNPFTLVRYLGREQYGSNPLIYGQYFDAPYDIEVPEYWTPLNGKYIKTDGQVTPKYRSEGKMFFPRMWSSADQKYIDFYESYMSGGGKKVPGAKRNKPTFGDNMRFFFDYQLNWMYWRYFMWNFAGRQNDIHSPVPGDMFTGNWECGIGFIDEFRLGDQSNAPSYLKDNKGKNHYYMLPLLLGLIGLFFQCARDRRGAWVTFLLFFMTGIAIVVYLNQTPYQVRERDYAYAGSFYAFSIWTGLAVAALWTWIEKLMSRVSKGAVAASVAVSLLCLCVPALMAAENWDDHDRSHRYTAVEIAKNYLNSVGENGILITHGDNDTFPLWYAQEVENVRTDVRICNTSLLGTDWHIDQMKYAVNESAPLSLGVPPEQYLYGTNEWIPIYDTRDQVIPIDVVMAVFRHKDAKIQMTSGRAVDYIMSRKISIPVNRENVLKYGILPEEFADSIPDEIVLTMSKDKDFVSKPELFMLDLLSNYQWDRPINMLSMGGDINIGLKEYLLYEGFSFKVVPIRNKMRLSDIGLSDPQDLYEKMTSTFTFDALKRTDWYVDYQNMYTFCGVMSHRLLFLNAAREMAKVGWDDRAIELLDLCQECVPEENFPLEMSYLGFNNESIILNMIDMYFVLEEQEKAMDLALRMKDALMESVRFYIDFYDYTRNYFEDTVHQLFVLSDIMKQNGFETEGEDIVTSLNTLVEQYS